MHLCQGIFFWEKWRSFEREQLAKKLTGNSGVYHPPTSTPRIGRFPSTTSQKSDGRVHPRPVRPTNVLTQFGGFGSNLSIASPPPSTSKSREVVAWVFLKMAVLSDCFFFPPLNHQSGAHPSVPGVASSLAAGGPLPQAWRFAVHPPPHSFFGGGAKAKVEKRSESRSC